MTRRRSAPVRRRAPRRRPAAPPPDPAAAPPTAVAEEVAKIVAAAGEPAGYRDLIAPSIGAPQGVAAITWFPYFKARYTDTGNPLFAWEALRVALGAGLPPPAWVTAYLVRVADHLHTLTQAPPARNGLAATIYRALEFTPRHHVSPFDAIAGTAHDVGIALAVREELRRGKKLDFAIVDVARAHAAHCGARPPCTSLSRSTVVRCWQRYRAYLEPSAAGDPQKPTDV